MAYPSRPFPRRDSARREAAASWPSSAAAELDRILVRFPGELVDETLHRPYVVVGPDAPPETGRNGRRLVALEFDLEVRDVVRDVDALSTESMSMSFITLNSPGRKRAMMDEPVTRWRHPTMRPSAMLADAVIVLIADDLGRCPRRSSRAASSSRFAGSRRRPCAPTCSSARRGSTRTASTAIAHLAAGRLDRLERLLDPDGRQRREALLDVARSVYAGDALRSRRSGADAARRNQGSAARTRGPRRRRSSRRSS